MHPADVKGHLKSFFKHADYKSVEQEEACCAVVAGRDVFVTLPTGAGKSLIFQLGAVCRGGVAVVIEPLIALIQNQISNSLKIGLCATTINGATSASERTRIVQMLMDSHEPAVLYITAEMAAQMWLRDQLARLHASGRLALICVDEAHVVSAWADDFRPDYAKLGSLRALAPTVPLAALSATAPACVISDVSSRLLLAHDALIARQRPRRHNLFLEVVRSDRLANAHANVAAFTTSVLTLEETGSVIVYCRSKAQCEEMVHRLREFDVQCLLYHADRRKEERELVQQLWLQDKTRVVVATVAFGLGIDKANVRGVVHMTAPASLSAYAQEVGRGGRDGKRSYCRLYLKDNEARSVASIVTEERKRLMTVPKEKRLPQHVIDERVRKIRNNFDSALNFANDNTHCRHQIIARHLDFAVDQPCATHCDNCINK